MKYNEAYAELMTGIKEYYIKEYNDDREVIEPQDNEIPLAYTTYSFDEGQSCEHEIQVSFDIKEWCYNNYIDDELVLVEPRAWADNVGEEIAMCSFEDIIRSAVFKGAELYEEVQN